MFIPFITTTILLCAATTTLIKINNNNSVGIIMPTRSVSFSDELYKDLHVEMERDVKTFSQVIVRRLNRLKEIEEKEVITNAE